MTDVEKKEMAAFIKRVCCFCLEHQGRCFKNLESWAIFRYIAFHKLAKQLFVTEENGKITGVAIGWLTTPEEIARREKQGEPVFQWTLLPTGKALYIAQLFGTRRAAAELWHKCLEQWPHITQVFIHRQRNGAHVLREVSLTWVGRVAA